MINLLRLFSRMLLDSTARELAINLHHPMPQTSTERARKLAQKTPASASKVGGGDDTKLASPHHRSIEDFWSVHSKVCPTI